MNKKLVIALVAVAVIGAGVAGGVVWFMSKSSTPAEAAAEAKKKEEKKAEGKPPKYLTVDKVIIMLKRQPGDTSTHYMSADLVVTTNEEHEKHAKESLPLLRSIAVKTLSELPLATAQAMTIDQYATELNKAFDATFEHEHREKPFTEVMIGKLIIE